MPPFVKGWHIPQGVRIAFSTRRDGVSTPPYESLNLGLHVGDCEEKVLQNRALIRERFELPNSPAWLEQTHSTRVIVADNQTVHDADGSYAEHPNQVCVVMTADCLPVLLCDRAGTEVAAVHAGWKGLCDGIIEVALEKFKSDSDELIAYLGPAIGADAFEVGEEVREMFISVHPDCDIFFISKASSDSTEKKYLADLQGLAKFRLNLAGVNEVYQADTCTFKNADNYFSYRRDNVTGRMASFIWLV
ncbi:peptidoglycan editing factor PgeF [uncultured Shewanella sp.]|uniref:peptidoglycan editing factor PgeF n=1 Tax=Shewanella atlantica TaxID=271099 RepID=UPI0026282AB5|nr:peptidoglycan editing factor PgeF [uncultured Shewanella sp.]